MIAYHAGFFLIVKEETSLSGHGRWNILVIEANQWDLYYNQRRYEMGTASSLFRENLIFLLDEEKDYSEREILQYIGGKLTELGYAKESFTEALLEREEQYPTGLAIVPYPVAIPHTDPGHVYHPCVCMVRLKRGVEFHEMVDTESKVKVNFIFCIALPGGEKQTDVLQNLMDISGNRSVMEALKKAESAEEVFQILCARE